LDEFKEEVTILKKLTSLHKNTYFPNYEDDNIIYNTDRVFFVMQYGNCTIYDLCRYKDQQRFDEKTIYIIIEQIIEGLLTAKKEGISHGDIKPNNFLFFKDDEKYPIKISD